MGVNRWCMQCATDPSGRREVPAVGVDEDGEPACYHHATMESVRKTCGITPPEEKQAMKHAASQLDAQQAGMRARQKVTCTYPGCEKTIARWNRSGRCPKHRNLVGPRATREQPGLAEAMRELPPPVELPPPDVEPIRTAPSPGVEVARSEFRRVAACAELRALREKLTGEIAAIDRVLEMLA